FETPPDFLHIPFCGPLPSGSWTVIFLPTPWPHNRLYSQHMQKPGEGRCYVNQLPPLRLDLPRTGCETQTTRAQPMTYAENQAITVGVTGASGAILAQKALDLLERDSRVARIHLVVTEAGQRLFAEELHIASGDVKQLPARILGRTATRVD